MRRASSCSTCLTRSSRPPRQTARRARAPSVPRPSRRAGRPPSPRRRRRHRCGGKVGAWPNALRLRVAPALSRQPQRLLAQPTLSSAAPLTQNAESTTGPAVNFSISNTLLQRCGGGRRRRAQTARPRFSERRWFRRRCSPTAAVLRPGGPSTRSSAAVGVWPLQSRNCGQARVEEERDRAAARQGRLRQVFNSYDTYIRGCQQQRRGRQPPAAPFLVLCAPGRPEPVAAREALRTTLRRYDSCVAAAEQLAVPWPWRPLGALLCGRAAGRAPALAFAAPRVVARCA
jgi:hypothetical protein